MKIKTFSEMELRIDAEDLAALLYRAKQGEIQFHEKKALEEKVTRLKKEYAELLAAHTKMKAETEAKTDIEGKDKAEEEGGEKHDEEEAGQEARSQGGEARQGGVQEVRQEMPLNK